MKTKRLSFFIFSAALFFICYQQSAAKEAHEITRTYTLVSNEFSLPRLGMDCAERTFKAVADAIKPHKLIIERVKTIEEIDKAMTSKSADFVVVGSAIYWRHLRGGYRDIATLITPEQPDPDHAVGALVVTRADDSRVNVLGDLKGKILGVNDPIGFQGILALKKELSDRGYDVDNFFKNIFYYGLDPAKRLEALRRGEVDAVTLNACYVERELKKGRHVLEGLKAIDTRKNQSNCQTSTALYPNWSFLIAPSIDNKILVKVANSLYAMPEEPDGQKWTLASDFRGADNLYKALKIGPYSYLTSWTFERIWDEYRIIVLLLFPLVIFACFHVIRTRHLIKVRTKELNEALIEQKKLRKYSEKLTRQQEESRRIFTVSQISGLVAHELSHPLTSIQLYLRALEVLIKKDVPQERRWIFDEALQHIQKSASSADAIVQEVRDYAKSKNAELSIVDLKKCVEKSIESFLSAGDAQEKYFTFWAEGKEFNVLGRQLELELAVSNLIKNSLESAEDKPRVWIRIFAKDEKIHLLIEDNHKIISDAEYERIISPTYSLKDEGLGLGLSIVRGIVENHVGTVSFERLTRGLRVHLIFPIAR